MRSPRTELWSLTLRGQVDEVEPAKEADEERPVRWEETQRSEV